MNKYLLKIKVWAEGEIVISANSEEEATDKLLRKDIVAIADTMAVSESDVDFAEVELIESK